MQKHKILFVDDEPNITSALTRAFRGEPYETFAAHMAQEALDVLNREQIDVVVSDEQMPEMDGSEFLSIVRCKFPRTIRMILTGHASLAAAISAINAGEVYRFFTKPCNEVDLKVSIRQALQQRDLTYQSRRLLREYQRQASVLKEMEHDNPGIAHLETDASGAILVEEISGDSDELLEQIREEMAQRIP